MFQSLREPPTKGSLRESVLLLYVLKKEEIEYSKELAMAQMVIDKDKGMEQFEKYRQRLFPWVETAKKREKDQHIKAMMEAIGKGPLSIRPLMGTTKGQSRLRRQQAPTKNVDRERMNKIYSRLGKTKP